MAETGIEQYVRAQEIDVPQDLFEEELRQLLIEDAHRAHYSSFVTGQIRILTPEEKNEAVDALKKTAFDHVKTELVMKKIIETQCFEVTPEELEEEALGISRRQGVTLEQIRDFLGEDLSALRRDILHKKAGDYLRSISED